MGPSKLRSRAGAEGADVPALQAPNDVIEDARWLRCRPCHSVSERSRYFSVTISRIGPDILRHAAVHQHQALLQAARASPRETSCVGRESGGSAAGGPRLIPNSGSPSWAATPWISLIPGHTPPESCQPPPEPPSHSPRMARAATRRRSSLRKPAGERADLVGGAHAHGDEAGQQVGGNRQPRAFGNVVHLADDFDAVARPACQMRQQTRRAAARRLPSPAARCRRQSPRP